MDEEIKTGMKSFEKMFAAFKEKHGDIIDTSSIKGSAKNMINKVEKIKESALSEMEKINELKRILIDLKLTDENINEDDLNEEINEEKKEDKENDNNIFKSMDGVINSVRNYKSYRDVKAYFSKIKDEIDKLKKLYQNYCSLDKADQKRINEDLQRINKEKIQIIKENLILAFQYFNELTSDQKQCFYTLSNSIVEEINDLALKEQKKKKLIIDLFENYTLRVDVTFNSFFARMIDRDISEADMRSIIKDLLELRNQVIEAYNHVDDEIKRKYYIHINESTQTLYTIIKSYNELAASSISIMKDPIRLIDPEDEVDVSGAVLALSNNKLDLYRIHYYNNPVLLYGNYNDHSYNAGYIYVGLVNEDIAIKKVHSVISSVDDWANVGGAILHNNHMYYASVDGIEPIRISYNQLRNEMYYSKWQIVPYFDDNKSTMCEIREVLDYGTKKLGYVKDNQKIYK